MDSPRGEAQHQVQVTINGQAHSLSVPPRRTLLQLSREGLNLTGTKEGCSVGTCGACTVLLDGRAVLSCMLLLVQVDGRRVETIEALSDGDDPLISAFIRHDAFQCGFCTPGQITTLRALLTENPRALTGSDSTRGRRQCLSLRGSSTDRRRRAGCRGR